MLSYANRLYTEAELEAIDNGDDRRGFEPLSTIARRPAVIAAVNACREVSPKDRWFELSKPSNRDELTHAEKLVALNLMHMMPGYCCMMDALSIAGRL